MKVLHEKTTIWIHGSFHVKVTNDYFERLLPKLLNGLFGLFAVYEDNMTPFLLRSHNFLYF